MGNPDVTQSFPEVLSFTEEPLAFKMMCTLVDIYLCIEHWKKRQEGNQAFICLGVHESETPCSPSGLLIQSLVGVHMTPNFSRR